MPRKEEDVIKRLENKSYNRGDCKIFVGKTTGRDSGYGAIWYKGKTASIGRVICHLFHGADLNDSTWVACHKPECQSSMCWNPDHLYVGNALQNVRDQMEAGTHHHVKTGTHFYKGWKKNE